jgi:hypothetical protein
MKSLIERLFGRPSWQAPSSSAAGGDGDDEPWSIDAALRDHFAPVLRGHGFAGSGRHFRRVANGVFQTVNVQGSSAGGSFAVNLGLHVLALPDARGELLDARKAKEIECDFRRRLAADDGDKWWSYSDTRGSTIAAASDAARLFETHGLPRLDALSAPESPLFTLTADRFERERQEVFAGFGIWPPNLVMTLARLRRVQGRLDEVAAFIPILLAELDRYGDRQGHAARRGRYLEEIEALARTGA